MRQALPLAALLLCAALAPVPARSGGTELPYAHFHTPPAVDWVQLCGRWGGARGSGVYRVIHAALNGQSYLYVQWMQPDADGALAPAHTMAVHELDTDQAGIMLSQLDCRASPRGIVVTARASSGHDARLRRVAIEIGPAFDQYRLLEGRMR